MTKRQRMFATVAQKKTMKESAVLSIEVRNVMKYKNHSTKSDYLFGRNNALQFPPIFPVGVKKKEGERCYWIAPLDGL